MNDPLLPFDANQLVELKRVSQIAVAPDGSWIAAAVQRLDADGAKYISELWRVPLDGGLPIQLTRGEHGGSSPCFRADGALGFLSGRPPIEAKSDEDSKERKQVWLLPVAGGEALQLTDEP
ncbi:MAG: S9 family peptidase, partial [Casimicrobiaceae bacterium]